MSFRELLRPRKLFGDEREETGQPRKRAKLNEAFGQSHACSILCDKLISPLPSPFPSPNCKVGALCSEHLLSNLGKGRGRGGGGTHSPAPTRPPHERISPQRGKENRQQASKPQQCPRAQKLQTAAQHALSVLFINRSKSYSLWGSNPRPMAHKTIALTTELRELWLC